VLEWGFALLHRQAARGALTADGWGYPSLVSTSDGWSYPTPFWRLGVVRTLSPLSWTVRPLEALWRLTVGGFPVLSTAGCTLPLSDGWNNPSLF
jgi:hypothetical protein